MGCTAMQRLKGKRNARKRRVAKARGDEGLTEAACGEGPRGSYGGEGRKL